MNNKEGIYLLCLGRIERIHCWIWVSRFFTLIICGFEEASHLQQRIVPLCLYVLHTISLFIYDWRGEYVMCVEVRGRLIGVSSLLQPCGSQGSKFRSLGLVVSTLLDELLHARQKCVLHIGKEMKTEFCLLNLFMGSYSCSGHCDNCFD